jgi:hypothetical protein
MKTGWWMSVILIWAPAAIADTMKLLPTALEMPDRIGPLAYTGKPDTWADKRLGMSYKFVAPGMILDIYAYDAGVMRIPEGAGSRPVCEQFEQAKSELLHGGYKDAVLKGEQLARMGPTQDPPLAREAVFEAVMQDAPVISYVWITGAAGNFIKIRFSISAQLRYEVEDARRAVLNAVGDAIRPHLVPAGPAQPGGVEAAAGQDVKGKQVKIVMGPGTAAEPGFGMSYLVGLSTLTARSDVALPACGGRLRPAFATEVATWQLALRVATRTAAGSKFSNKVVEAEGAGYLEEFIWTLNHQEHWGDTPPESLDLKAFSKWSRKHLKNVRVPDFGYVDINHVRELPIERL